jgi:hypothetical protein
MLGAKREEHGRHTYMSLRTPSHHVRVLSHLRTYHPSVLYFAVLLLFASYNYCEDVQDLVIVSHERLAQSQSRRGKSREKTLRAYVCTLTKSPII